MIKRRKPSRLQVRKQSDSTTYSSDAEKNYGGGVIATPTIRLRRKPIILDENSFQPRIVDTGEILTFEPQRSPNGHDHQVLEQYKELSYQYEDLESAYKLMAVQNLEFKQKAKRLEKKCNTQTQELSLLRDSNRELSSELIAIRKHYDRLMNTHRERKEEMAAFRRVAKKFDMELDVEAFEEILVFMNDYEKFLEDAKSIWNEKRSTYKKKIVDLKGEVNVLKNQNEKLRNALYSQQDAENSSKNKRDPSIKIKKKRKARFSIEDNVLFEDSGRDRSESTQSENPYFWERKFEEAPKIIQKSRKKDLTGIFDNVLV